VLLLFSVFLYMAMYQVRITLKASKVLEQKEFENRDSKNAALVFTLLPKYPEDPFHDWLNRPRTLLERDLKRLGSKAATISANAVQKICVLFPVHGKIYPDGYVRLVSCFSGSLLIFSSRFMKWCINFLGFSFSLVC